MILDSIETKEKILDEFLKICIFDGWNEKALEDSLEKCGISKNSLPLIFEDSCLSLANFYIEKQNQKSLEKISEIEDFHSKKIRDKIRLALYARFEVEKDNKDQLQRLVNFYLSPKNFCSKSGPKPALQGTKSCFLISDSIWKSINDSSTDFNYYTKRATLSKIILKTLRVFLKDEDDDLEKTKRIIDDEIESVMKFEKRKSQIKSFSKNLKENIHNIAFDKDGAIKPPKEIIKKLPFFRLIKF